MTNEKEKTNKDEPPLSIFIFVGAILLILIFCLIRIEIHPELNSDNWVPSAEQGYPMYEEGMSVVDCVPICMITTCIDLEAHRRIGWRDTEGRPIVIRGNDVCSVVADNSKQENGQTVTIEQEQVIVQPEKPLNQIHEAK